MARQKQPVFFILFFVCSLLFSCRPVPQYPEELLQANLLTQTDPDSALQVLEAMSSQMQHASEPILRYYQLLTIKAKDKAFITHTSDSLILSLLHYYEEKGDIRLLPEACYYAGRVTRDLGDAPQALDYFHQALDAMSQPSYQQSMKGKEHDNLQLQGKIHAQMGYLFKRQHLYDEAIKSFEQAYWVDSINKDTMGMMLSLIDQGNALQLDSQFDKALRLYQIADSIAMQNQDTETAIYVKYQIASIYNEKGEYKRAKGIVTDLPLQVTKLSQSSVYSILGSIYANNNEYENAAPYFECLLESNSVIARSNANIWLSNYSINKGEIEKSINFSRAFLEQMELVSYTRNEEAITLSHSLYNYHLREKEIDNLKIQRTTLTARLWMVATISVLFLLLLYIEYARRRSVKRRYDHLQRILSANKQYIEQKQALMLKAITDMKSSAMYELIEQKSKRRETLTSKEWKAIETLLDRYMPEFIPRLKGVHSFNDTEWKLSLLLKMELKLPQIAPLIGLTYVAIYASHARLFKKVIKENVTYKNWTEFISSL